MNDQPPRTTDDRLEEILVYIRKHEARERRKAFWGSISAFIRLLPIFITIYFAYYFYMNGTEIMSTLIKESAEATTRSYTNSMQNSTEVTDKIKEFLSTQK